ncbi:histidine kinase/DNA gyrase B/HSP90-like ATPase [Salegentibacter sp. 24]|uniref:ATP-binding protein n=1 Tax=Salegentibacter sp. 24 TaxID=2183986 RepID=UPI00105C2910|nr:ATP-binding protein [Salegentibacter sp. 24]TDN87062.1 histidine kinase/DNA gyrase B/HSP90-like ATPase [Salegentibacter sp. 24]
MSNFEKLSINADRICEAISKIGYRPSSAIMDIVDNSVVAEASNITIRLFMKKGKSLNNAQNIEKIQIVDNGNGMDNSGIKKALQLGSDVEYKDHSLSKYGLGLKSAGFSLGRRIEVVSKTNENLSKKFFLDRDVIRDKDEFGYEIEEPSTEQVEMLKEFQSGTVVTFRKLTYTSKVSAGKIMEKVAERSGVSYCDYLNKKNAQFDIHVLREDSNEILKKKSVKSKDMLFWQESLESFVKESYDCKKPCKVLDDEFENPLNPEGEKIKIQATIFPKDSMKTYPAFTPEEQNNIKKYQVGAKNSGFYFYRNGRLIKWGEKLFKSRLYGFRAKISFSTEHDELFGVDVSKQHLTVSDEVEQTIDLMTKVPRGQSQELFRLCDEKFRDYKNKGTEGEEFNSKNSTLEEEEDETGEISAQEVLDRKAKLEQDSEKYENEDNPDYQEDGDEQIFRRVRYWNRGRNLYERAMDRVEGTYVLINTNHPFYDLVISKFEKGSSQRQSLEALIFSLAVGENQTIQKFMDVNADLAIEVFNKFNRSSSNQLDNWVNNNQDLYEGED